MSDPLYRRELLRLAADAHGAGRLPSPTATGTAFNPACGDRVTVDLVVENGRVTAVAQEIRACVLAQASAAILGVALEGQSQEDVVALKDAITAMLAEDGAVPGSPFGAYIAFDGVAEHPARHKCVLLPVEAVLDAFEKSERR